MNSPAAPLLVRRWMKVPSNTATATNIKAATAYKPHLLCVSAETQKKHCVSGYFVGVVCALMHGLIHRKGMCWYTCYTHSLGTEFFYHAEQDLTATPADRQS